MNILKLRTMEILIILLISVYSLFSQQSAKIGLVVHVIRYDDGSGGISLSTVDQAIDDLNIAFSFLNAEFERYVTRYHNSSYYAEMSESDLVNLFAGYNIYANKAINVYFAPNPGFIGIGTLPPNRGALINEPYIGDGIVVENQYALTSTFPHEFGHFFGLFHTYEIRTGFEIPDGSNWWAAGDLLEDTPAEPQPAQGSANWANDCVHYIGKKFYKEGMAYDTVENRDNYMAASPRHCRDAFTHDQRNLMKDMYNSGERNYLKDVPWIQFTNKIGTLNAGGTFKIENHIFDSGEYYPCPFYALDVETGQERLQTDYKHHDWNEVNINFRLIYEDFTATLTTPPQEANFNQMNSVSITTHNLHSGEMDVGKIQFKDPWYVHSDYSQPDDFFEYDDLPFYPTGSYYQTTGGVFLDQEPDPQHPDAPYYSVRAPTQPQTVNGKELTYDLDQWSADPAGSAEFQSATSETTPVIFRQDGAVVTANMKARRTSDTPEATAGNNGYHHIPYRHHETEMMPEIIYQDRGNIYRARRYSEDHWYKDRLIYREAENTFNSLPAAAYLHYADLLQTEWHAYVWDSYDIVRNEHYTLYTLINSNGYQTSVIFSPDITEDRAMHPSVSGYVKDSNPTTIVAYRGKEWSLEKGPGTPKLTVWFPEEGENIKSLVDAGITADYPSLDNVKFSTTSFSPHYLLSWQEEDGIYYIEINYNIEHQNIEFVEGTKKKLTAEYPYLNENAYPAISSVTSLEDSFRTYVTWQSTDASCSSCHSSIPAVCFRQKSTQGWEELQIFYLSNNADRNPVITGWNYPEDNVSIAYQETDNRINYLCRQGSNWNEPVTLTEDGVNPAITTLGTVPSVIWTESENEPYRVLIAQPEGEQRISNQGLPHRRRLSFNLKESLNGSQFLTIQADVTLEMAEAELFSSTGSEKLRFQFTDSLLTPINAFQFQPFTVSSQNYYLQIPVRIYVQNFRQNKTSELIKQNLPYWKLQVKNANNNQIISTLHTYQTSQLAGNGLDNFMFTDTFLVDLHPFIGKKIQLEGVTYLLKNAPHVGLAELYDLRRIAPLEKQTLAFEETQMLPASYRLYQNYPNPFNPTTTISFDLPEESRVVLEIYDITGRKIRTLAEGRYPAGTHKIVWDGRDSRGQAVASGVYAYRLQAGKHVTTRKLLLMK